MTMLLPVQADQQVKEENVPPEIIFRPSLPLRSEGTPVSTPTSKKSTRALASRGGRSRRDLITTSEVLSNQ